MHIVITYQLYCDYLSILGLKLIHVCKMDCRPLGFTTVGSLPPLLIACSSTTCRVFVPPFLCGVFCYAREHPCQFAEEVEMFWAFYWYSRLDVYTFPSETNRNKWCWQINPTFMFIYILFYAVYFVTGEKKIYKSVNVVNLKIFKPSNTINNLLSW